MNFMREHGHELLLSLTFSPKHTDTEKHPHTQTNWLAPPPKSTCKACLQLLALVGDDVIIWRHKCAAGTVQADLESIVSVWWEKNSKENKMCTVRLDNLQQINEIISGVGPWFEWAHSHGPSGDAQSHCCLSTERSKTHQLPASNAGYLLIYSLLWWFLSLSCVKYWRSAGLKLLWAHEMCTPMMMMIDLHY